MADGETSSKPTTDHWSGTRMPGLPRARVRRTLSCRQRPSAARRDGGGAAIPPLFVSVVQNLRMDLQILVDRRSGASRVRGRVRGRRRALHASAIRCRTVGVGGASGVVAGSYADLIGDPSQAFLQAANLASPAMLRCSTTPQRSPRRVA